MTSCRINSAKTNCYPKGEGLGKNCPSLEVHPTLLSTSFARCAAPPAITLLLKSALTLSEYPTLHIRVALLFEVKHYVVCSFSGYICQPLQNSELNAKKYTLLAKDDHKGCLGRVCGTGEISDRICKHWQSRGHCVGLLITYHGLSPSLV